jgi:hypothetical protein
VRSIPLGRSMHSRCESLGAAFSASRLGLQWRLLHRMQRGRRGHTNRYTIERSPAADVTGRAPIDCQSNSRDASVGGVGPVPVQMWEGPARS